MQNSPAEIGAKRRPMRVLQLEPETAVLERWSTSDEAEHVVRVWGVIPQHAVVFYLHGIEGHGRWFEETALALNKKGVTVYALDRRGAGSSNEPRGHAQSWKRLVDDADELLQEVRKRNPDVPCFLVANCWGAKVALAAAARVHNQTLSGLVLTSPAVCVQVDVSPLEKLQIGLDYIFAGGKRLFNIPLTPEHFTDVPEFLDYIIKDKLRLTKATASFFVESLKLTRACKEAANKLNLPLLVLQSGRDGIVNVEKLKQWFQALPAHDKTLTMFTEAAHSLDFDYRMNEYQEAVASWILVRANSNKSGQTAESDGYSPATKGAPGDVSVLKRS